MLLKKHNGQLPVAVNLSQQQTMVSETVDKIDWSLPLTITSAGLYPWDASYIVQMLRHNLRDCAVAWSEEFHDSVLR